MFYLYNNYDDCILEYYIHIHMSITFNSFNNELWLFYAGILWWDVLIVLGVDSFMEYNCSLKWRRMW